MTKEEYLLLYEKLLSGNCTDQEKELLANYLDEFELEEHPWSADMGNREQVRDEIYNRLRAGVPVKKPSFKKLLLRISAVAATLIIILLTGVYKFFFHPFPDISSVKQEVPRKLSHEVRPGGNKAVLTLANGAVIVLDSSRSGVLASRNGVEVKQVQKGQVLYNSLQPAAPSSFNTLVTPVGGQYQIVLEDGTKAWLNAASSLRFPATFRDNERLVEVTGEVYFEVAEDEAKPFKVRFNGSTVMVLGTRFNVMAYPEEEHSKVTLLEGAVQISNQAGRRLLKPGMQALVSDSLSVATTRKANLEEAVAWKNGYFVFDNESIQSIMRKIARWYDVTVAYQGNMAGKEFSGTISRYENVSEVLSMLELTESIHFTLRGRSITVTP